MTVSSEREHQQAVQAMAVLQTLSAQRAAARAMTPEEADEVEDSRCAHCGGFHVRACPRVRRIEFHPNGSVAAVEFWRADQTDWTGVVWDDVGDDEVVHSSREA